jgi:hypothetical protein
MLADQFICSLYRIITLFEDEKKDSEIEILKMDKNNDLIFDKKYTSLPGSDGQSMLEHHCHQEIHDPSQNDNLAFESMIHTSNMSGCVTSKSSQFDENFVINQQQKLCKAANESEITKSSPCSINKVFVNTDETLKIDVAAMVDDNDRKTTTFTDRNKEYGASISDLNEISASDQIAPFVNTGCKKKRRKIQSIDVVATNRRSSRDHNVSALNNSRCFIFKKL